MDFYWILNSDVLKGGRVYAVVTQLSHSHFILSVSLENKITSKTSSILDFLKDLPEIKTMPTILVCSDCNECNTLQWVTVKQHEFIVHNSIETGMPKTNVPVD